MEEKFVTAWLAARQTASEKGVRMRTVSAADALRQAHRQLSGSRCSDGFDALADRGLLKLSLEALVVDKRFTALFSDDEANNALTRLLSAGYYY